MEHHPVAHINPHMGHRAGAVIGSREKDNVAGLCLGGGNDSALVINLPPVFWHEKRGSTFQSSPRGKFLLSPP